MRGGQKKKVRLKLKKSSKPLRKFYFSAFKKSSLSENSSVVLSPFNAKLVGCGQKKNQSKVIIEIL